MMDEFARKPDEESSGSNDDSDILEEQIQYHFDSDDAKEKETTNDNHHITGESSTKKPKGHRNRLHGKKYQEKNEDYYYSAGHKYHYTNKDNFHKQQRGKMIKKKNLNFNYKDTNGLREIEVEVTDTVPIITDYGKNKNPADEEHSNLNELVSHPLSSENKRNPSHQIYTAETEKNQINSCLNEPKTYNKFDLFSPDVIPTQKGTLGLDVTKSKSTQFPMSESKIVSEIVGQLNVNAKEFVPKKLQKK